MSDGLESDSDSIDDDIFRDVDAFSDSDSDDPKSKKSQYLAKMYMSHETARTMADRAKSIEGFNKLNQTGKSNKLNQTGKSKKSQSIYLRSRALSRTDLKLIEKGDQPLKGMLIYILYTILYSLCFLCARYLY